MDTLLEADYPDEEKEPYTSDDVRAAQAKHPSAVYTTKTAYSRLGTYDNAR